DWFGATVNLAARVAAQASGGQLLGTAEVAAAASSAGFTVIELGALQLRNLSEPVELFQIEICPELAGTALDPVCRMQVPRAEAAGRLRYRQHDFWFCSLG